MQFFKGFATVVLPVAPTALEKTGRVPVGPEDPEDDPVQGPEKWQCDRSEDPDQEPSAQKIGPVHLPFDGSELVVFFFFGVHGLEGFEG
jgi:hypothetical protein